MRRVLVIEDEASVASALVTLVERMGCRAVAVASGARGLEQLRDGPPALVVLDIGLPDRNGIEVLGEIRALHPELPVLVVTAHGNLHNAVEAKKRGATGYLVKPLDLPLLRSTLEALLQPAVAPAVAGEPGERHSASLLIGSAPAMQPAFAAIAHAAASDVPVLITGPTGIGKSLTARIVHRHSARHQAPFVTLSCASLPESLLEAELFGHERGAFTGAQATRIGHIERAAGGTLFLDEIGEVPMPLQVKLLRFVEEKVFVRVGGREDVSVDLRIIAATNQDLERAVADKRFREDLYYRLRVLEVRLPPLGERLSDLPALCAFLLAGIGGTRPLRLADATLEVLRSHPWPGNVRELRNVLEHAAAVCSGSTILPIHLPATLPAGERVSASAGSLSAASFAQVLQEWLDRRLAESPDYDALHDELERQLLVALLPRYGNKPTLLARALRMHRGTLRRRLRNLGVTGGEDGDEGDGDDGTGAE